MLGGKKLRMMAVALMSAFRVREALVVVFPVESNVEPCKQLFYILFESKYLE